MKWIAVCLFWAGSAVSSAACVLDATQLTPTEPVSADVFAKLEPIVVSKPFGLELTVCAPLSEDTEITVDAWMPAHQHGMNYVPSINALGEGQFAISNLVFHMPGIWQIRVAVEVEGAPSAYQLDIDVK